MVKKKILINSLLIPLVAGQVAAKWDTYSDTWHATDNLSRIVADNTITGDVKPDKTAGIFYYIWHGQHGTAGPFDISQILLGKQEYGPVHLFHHWSEPLFGYYLPNDEWVVRRHAQMLKDAGIDVIIFDATNAFTYNNIYLNLCRIYTALRAAGQTTPQIAFLTWSDSGNTVKRIYDEFYAKG